MAGLRYDVLASSSARPRLRAGEKKMAIQEAVLQAIEYAENYPGELDVETRLAIFYSHLAWLINSNLAN